MLESNLFSGIIHAWWFSLIPLILSQYVVVEWVSKHVANQPSQIAKQVVSFGGCAAMATAFTLITHTPLFNPWVIVIMSAGVLNAFANIYKWRATRISQSKTSVLSFGDDIIAIVLSMAFLHDGRYLDSKGLIGMSLCVLTGILFWWHDSQEKSQESRAFYLNVLRFSLLWGVAMFAQRAFGLKQLPLGVFLFGWYVGTFMTLVTVFITERIKTPRAADGSKPPLFNTVGLAWAPVHSLAITINIVILYWTVSRLPQTVVQPVMLIGQAMVAPLVGWLIFREGKKFDRFHWGFVALGVVGVILLGFGFINTKLL